MKKTFALIAIIIAAVTRLCYLKGLSLYNNDPVVRYQVDQFNASPDRRNVLKAVKTGVTIGKQSAY